jgi:hypothetical protein
MQNNILLSGLLTQIRNLIHSREFLEEFRIQNHFIRNRLLSMEKMVVYLLLHSKLSLDSRTALLQGLLPDYDFPSVSRQALSKARYGIRYELFRELFEISVDYYYANRNSRKLWANKYHLFAIDGSIQEVPSSESTFEEFGKQHDYKNPTLFWSMALASILYDVTDDIIVDAAIEHQFFSERELALRHRTRFFDLGLQEDSIIIFDRGYYSAEAFCDWTSAGCKCLMRIKQPNSLCSFEGYDVVKTVCAPDGTEMPCRLIKYPLPTAEIEYLITNVMDEDLTDEMFGELYFQRWKIETKYLEIKEHWKIEEFTGTGALAVRQDFFITMLHANLAALIKQQADEIIDRVSNPANAYKYVARRTYIISSVHINFVKWIIRSFTQNEIDEVILDASKKRSQIKPNRSSERKRRTRARKHYNNRKSTF